MAYNKAGIRFSKDSYVIVDAEGGAKRKLLWKNPDTSQEMQGITLFQESELEGYTHISFAVTDTSGSYVVEELCEIEPLKTHGGQFVVSMPTAEHLYCRKIYRSMGAVKVSTAVYDLGKTTQDKNYCIIKKVEAVKIGE